MWCAELEPSQAFTNPLYGTISAILSAPPPTTRTDGPLIGRLDPMAAILPMGISQMGLTKLRIMAPGQPRISGEARPISEKQRDQKIDSSRSKHQQSNR